MSAPTNQNEQFRDLVAGYADGRLGGDEVATLEQQLAADAHAKEQFVLYMDIHARLHWNNRAEAATTSPSAEEQSAFSHRLSADGGAEQIAPAPSPRSKSLLDRMSRHQLPSSLGITLAIFVAVIVGLAFTPVGKWIAEIGGKDAQPRQPVVQPEFVAWYMGAHNAEWLNGTKPEKTRLKVGQRMAIEKGLIEIQYVTGARVVIEGPAEYEVRGVKSGYLQVGKLVAQVTDERAKDFSVDTPFARVDDRGTEFGVTVDPKKGLDVICITGLIDVAAKIGQPRRLAKGESIRVHTDGRFSNEASSLIPEQFVRVMPQQTRQEAANVINVDIQKPGNVTFAGQGAYTFEGDFWNAVSKVGTPSQPLKTSNGQPSRVTVEIESCSLTRTLINNTGHGLTDDYAFTKNAAGSKNVVGRFIIRGLKPGETYGVVLYGTAGVSSSSQDRVAKGASEGSLFTIGRTTKATSGLRPKDPQFRTGKDFVTFRDVPADSRGELKGTWTNNQKANAPFNTNPYGIFNGMQIVGDFANNEE